MSIITTFDLGDGTTADDAAPQQIVTVIDGGIGHDGAAGAQGAPGQGVPVGGTAAQVLAKASSTDYDTHWVDQTGGSGGGAVASVNGQTGVVVLGYTDVGADAAGAAAASQTAAVAAADAYTDGKLVAEVARADAAYDALGAASTAQAAAVAAAATDATGKVAAEATARTAAIATQHTADLSAFDAAGAAATAQAAAIAASDTVGAAAAALVTAKAYTDTETTRATTAEGLKLAKASNLSDLASAATARTNLELGTLATQSGTFSGTSSGTNTGDQGIPTTLPPNGAAGGDLSGTYPNPGVAKLNGTALSGLATGLLKNTTTTGVPSIAAAADVPTVAAGSTGPLSATDATTTNSRTPTAHHTSHESGGSDAVSLAASQITSGVFAIGRLATGTPDGTKFVRDDGTLVTPSGGGGSVFSGFYGDGSDGNVTISTTVTLTRDMFYDTLTVSGTGVLKTGGFRVHCKTAVNVQTGGVFQRDGIAATTANFGASGLSGGSVGGSSGGASGNTANGAAPAAGTNSYGGAGGGSGAGTGSGTGGVTPTAPAAALGGIRSLPAASLGLLLYQSSSSALVAGGGGGSGGGGDGTNSGGGGGSGGGVLILNARAVTNSGTISANGGTGGNGTGGNSGGGGGGGGGLVIVNTPVALTGSTPIANGGTGGTKTGTGTNGSAGGAGTVLVNVWS